METKQKRGCDITGFVLAFHVGALDDATLFNNAFDGLSDVSRNYLLRKGWVKSVDGLTSHHPALVAAAEVIFNEAFDMSCMTLAWGEGLSEDVKAGLNLV